MVVVFVENGYLNMCIRESASRVQSSESATDAKPTGERGRQVTKFYKLTPEGDAALEASAKSQERLFISYLSRKRKWIPELIMMLRQLLKNSA